MTVTTLETTLIRQANAIYESWFMGNHSTARAMLHQVPSRRLPFLVLVMCSRAAHDSDDEFFNLAEFLREDLE